MGNLSHTTGNVGVGPVLLPNPSCSLDITGYAGTTYPILLESNTDTCLLTINGKLTEDSTAPQIGSIGGNFVFRSGSTEIIRVNSNGVCVKTSTLTGGYVLDVNGIIGSQATQEADDGKTLTTKGYVDTLVGGGAQGGNTAGCLGNPETTSTATTTNFPVGTIVAARHNTNQSTALATTTLRYNGAEFSATTGTALNGAWKVLSYAISPIGTGTFIVAQRIS
jgi:hypothetical protein